MENNKVDLSLFDNSNFDKGTSNIRWILWMCVNALIFKPSWFPLIKVKVFLLKLFGAKLGKGIVIKPSVHIKFPWKLVIEDNVWIGENVWIDNLDDVYLGSNVCVSQGAMLLTGNHDFTLKAFDYRNAPIIIQNGVWLGAKTVVCPGVICYSHSILTVGSIATKNLESHSIYQGNPALKMKERTIQ